MGIGTSRRFPLLSESPRFRPTPESEIDSPRVLVLLASRVSGLTLTALLSVRLSGSPRFRLPLMESPRFLLPSESRREVLLGFGLGLGVLAREGGLSERMGGWSLSRSSLIKVK